MSSEHYLPNTLLLSVMKETTPYICNVKLKKELESCGIIISVGSACNTANKSASHVLDAIGANAIVKKGAIRISMSDNTTQDEIDEFARQFIDIVCNNVKKILK
jgi:cysteine sulfinate desulfinase/cysteine desulfurase-like protein